MGVDFKHSLFLICDEARHSNLDTVQETDDTRAPDLAQMKSPIYGSHCTEMLLFYNNIKFVVTLIWSIPMVYNFLKSNFIIGNNFWKH